MANLSSNGPGTVSAFKIDETTGALTQVAGSPFSAGGGRGVAVIHGQVRVRCQLGNGNVSAYSIDATMVR